MILRTTTFTVLVTITHDASVPAYAGQLSARIQQAIEEGTREHKPFASAMVNTWTDNRLARTTPNRSWIAKMHDDVRKSVAT